ncbi:hypothetical protein D3C85_1390560 [compost metagenome]
MENEYIAMQMAEMYGRGYSSRQIAAKFGWSAATVRRWLAKLGMDLGGSGRKLQITDEYVAVVKKMRADGKEWEEISRKLGFCVRQLQKRVYGK